MMMIHIFSSFSIYPVYNILGPGFYPLVICLLFALFLILFFGLGGYIYVVFDIIKTLVYIHDNCIFQIYLQLGPHFGLSGN